MTEDMGRFTTDKEGFCIIDFVGNEVWQGKYSDETKSLCNQLNNLFNENEQLKSQREDFKRALSEKDKEIMKLRRENNQMKRILND